MVWSPLTISKPRGEDQHLSTVFLLSTVTVIVSYVAAVCFMRSVQMVPAVVTGTHLTWETFSFLVKN